MLGCQLTFYTRQDRKHGAASMAEWLLHKARELNIGGATLIVANGGLGRDGKLHSARFFELGEQPVLVQVVLPEIEAQRLLAAVEEEDLQIFYVKIPVEFGVTNEKSKQPAIDGKEH